MAFELPFRAIPQTTFKGTGIKVMFDSSKCWDDLLKRSVDVKGFNMVYVYITFHDPHYIMSTVLW